jgi:hypothetical protein
LAQNGHFRGGGPPSPPFLDFSILEKWNFYKIYKNPPPPHFIKKGRKAMAKFQRENLNSGEAGIKSTPKIGPSNFFRTLPGGKKVLPACTELPAPPTPVSNSRLKMNPGGGYPPNGG